MQYAFLYTADDERVAKFEVAAGGTINGVTWTARGFDNKVLRTWESTGTDYTNWTWKEDYVYRGGSLLASIDEEGTKHFHLDHLGTPRLITDETGEKVAFHTYGKGTGAMPSVLDNQQASGPGSRNDRGTADQDSFVGTWERVGIRCVRLR